MRLQRLFPGIALVGVLALSSSIPVASAASASTYVTRGQYVEQLLQAVGIQPDNSAAQSFSDVPPSSPYFGYVEAAYKAGITTGLTAPANGKMGVFGVNQDLNRGEAAAFDLRAYDGGVATYAQNDSVWDAGYNPNNPAYAGQVSFLDYAAIPTALQGDVYTASAVGLLHGFTNGDFGPLQNLTSDQTVHLISQLKSVEAINGAYNWRWIDSNQGTVTEPRSVNAMQFLAYAIEGKPFSAVFSFINQSDAASLQASYAGIQQNWQQDYASKAPGVTWKVVGGGYTNGMSAPANEVMCADIVVLEAETSSGTPVNLATVMGIGGTGGPYAAIWVPDVVTDSNGLVVSIGSTYINHNSNDSVQSGESVAGVVMDLTAGQVAVGDNGMATAVVGGLGAAYTGNGQTAP